MKRFLILNALFNIVKLFNNVIRKLIGISID